ncbi:unnamed protein product [Allacma fusca]|uniref:Alpha-2-macroglobulin domain-containing protein n=1 Tax=Allacma fusca TaxID=39272 RepID=A0A8J2P600_9HEXA|nr:unnamed protein product [Allacma fusca]
MYFSTWPHFLHVVVLILTVNILETIADTYRVNTFGYSPTTQPPTVFTAIHSKIIVPFTPYNIIIFLDSKKHDENQTLASEPLWFKAKIEGGINTTYYESEEIVIYPGKFGTLSFTPNSLPPEFALMRFYARESTGKSHSTYSTLWVQTSARVKGRLEEILIDLDKPLYKPGEKVQIRTILFDPNNRPAVATNSSLSLRIEDPNQILIKSWTNVSSNTNELLRDFGLYKSQFLISNETTSGIWKVKAIAVTTHDNITESHSKTVEFEVDNHIRPKFEVFMNLPTYILLSDETVSVSIQVKYSNGGNFQGDCILFGRLKPVRNCDRVRETSLVFPVGGVNATLQEFSIQDLIKSGYTPRNGDTLEFEATVRENGTGKNITVVDFTRFVKFPHKIQVIEETIPAKRGLFYNITLQVVKLNNIPINDQTPDVVQIATNLPHTRGSKFAVPIEENGIIHLSFRIPPFDYSKPKVFTNYLCGSFFIEVTYKNYTYGHSPKHTGDNFKFIQLIPTSRFVSPNSNATIRVVANTRKMASLNYVLLSDNKVLTGDAASFPATDEYNLTIPIPSYEGSHLTIVVFTYLVRYELQAVRDSIVLTTVTPEQPDPNNFLTIKPAEFINNASKDVTVEVSSKEGSLVVLRGLDPSLLSLPYKQTEFSWEKLDWETNKFVYEENGFQNPNGETPYNIFTSAKKGNDGSMYCENSEHVKFQMERAFENRCVKKPKVNNSQSVLKWQETAGLRINEKIAEPKFFPKTWLWDDFQLTNSTVLNITIPNPDASKSWILTGYSLNPTQNIQLLRPFFQLTTNSPFSISLNLPYSVIKGELLTVQVLVQNYLPEDMNISIALEAAEGSFKYSNNSNNYSSTGNLTQCQPYSVCSATFVIELTQVGRIDFHARVKVQNGPVLIEDFITKQLLVEQPGREVKLSSSKLISLLNSTVTSYFESFFPPGHLLSKEKIKFSITSDILAESINSLQDLIPVLEKNAEQNMGNFAVATEILKYKQTVGNVKPEEKSDLITILENGYQSQLRYRLPDGSFSLYGKPDDKGSTWLTAFIIRSLYAAKEFITIDDRVIREGLTFILNHSDPTTGHFLENSKLQNSTPKRNEFESKTSLTAYCLVTLVETGGYLQDDERSVIEKAFQYLSTEVRDDDSYAIALTTYALQLNAALSFNATISASGFLNKLKLLAVMSSYEDTLHWETSNHEESKLDFNVGPAWIETTSYALMIYTINKETNGTLPIVKWILSKRNSRGRFASPRDTVVTLQALRKYVAAQKNDPTDLQLELTYSNGTINSTIDASKINAMQEFLLPSDTTLTTVTASGSGNFVAQLTWSQYMEYSDKEDALKLNISTVKTAQIFVKFSVCLSSVLEDGSDVLTIEVNLPSGYVLDNDELLELGNVSGERI